jgi:hypothetical protein
VVQIDEDDDVNSDVSFDVEDDATSVTCLSEDEEKEEKSPLSLGFDPGIDNAGFAAYRPETNEMKMWSVNLRLHKHDGEWRNERVTEPGIERWVIAFLVRFHAVFMLANVLAIEAP